MSSTSVVDPPKPLTQKAMRKGETDKLADRPTSVGKSEAITGRARADVKNTAVEDPAARNSVRKRAENSDGIETVDLGTIAFNPNAPELQTTFFSDKSNVVCVNAYPNGVTISIHKNRMQSDAQTNAEVEAEGSSGKEGLYPAQFSLRLKDTRDYQLAEGRYFLYKDSYAKNLERHFAELKSDGKLRDTVVFFGTTTDPFLPFPKKFNVTMACLDILERYRPGRVVVQTRSPMAISALPALKVMSDETFCSLTIESRLESTIQRYTPGQPRIVDRLVVADGLRLQGIKVVANVSPILPYGDVYRHAWDFAEMLDSHADFITLGCLATGNAQEEIQLKTLPLARQLVADKNFRWLRPYCYRNLWAALKVVCPEKLLLPVESGNRAAQLSLFAA